MACKIVFVWHGNQSFLGVRNIGFVADRDLIRLMQGTSGKTWPRMSQNSEGGSSGRPPLPFLTKKTSLPKEATSPVARDDSEVNAWFLCLEDAKFKSGLELEGQSCLQEGRSKARASHDVTHRSGSAAVYKGSRISYHVVQNVNEEANSKTWAGPRPSQPSNAPSTSTWHRSVGAGGGRGRPSVFETFDIERPANRTAHKAVAKHQHIFEAFGATDSPRRSGLGGRTRSSRLDPDQFFGEMPLLCTLV